MLQFESPFEDGTQRLRRTRETAAIELPEQSADSRRRPIQGIEEDQSPTDDTGQLIHCELEFVRSEMVAYRDADRQVDASILEAETRGVPQYAPRAVPGPEPKALQFDGILV
jgi:hypothetical protein